MDRPTQQSMTSRGSRGFRLLSFILLVSGGGLAIGALNVPGAWYAALKKPAFNPPDWIFAPVWTVLFVMIAVAGFRTFDQNPRRLAGRLWILQMTLNFAWSPVFFSLHRTGLALAIIIVLFVTIVAFAWRQWYEDRTAALLFFPYAAWVGFAMTLNAALLILN